MHRLVFVMFREVIDEIQFDQLKPTAFFHQLSKVEMDVFLAAL